MNRQEMMAHFDDPPPRRQKSHVSFSKSQPWCSGWQGWSNVVDVLIDGRKVGELSARGCSNRKYMEYSFSGDADIAEHYRDVFGLKAAQKQIKNLIEALGN